MGYYTFLVFLEATVEAPDPGEATDDLEDAIKTQTAALKNPLGAVIGVVHDAQVHLHWWNARPVEVLQIERAQLAARRAGTRRKRAATAKPKKPKRTSATRKARSAGSARRG